MDPQYQQDPIASNFANNTFRTNDDEVMGNVDDNMSMTPTGGYNNGYQEPPRRQSAQSENYPPANGSFSPSLDSDPNTRSNSGYQHQPQAYSRPGSGMSGSGGYGYSQTYQEQNQRPAHQDAGRTQNNVVIKVGMVGDAQIGKTSLMVKYVEGSWDEDYIQTLGETKPSEKHRILEMKLTIQVSTSWKRPSRSATRKLPSQYGISEVNGSLSTCYHWSAMMQSRSYSCLT
jgi:hypothetical protein